ncbi:MAG: glycerate kinase [Pseudomonadota bacterium]
MTHDADLLRDLFETAVAAADPMKTIPAALPSRPDGNVIVVGAGKASARMAEAVETIWGPCEGLVITRYGYARPCRRIEIVEAAHPVPDAAGEAATLRMLDRLAALGKNDFVLALISGGGSALLTSPAGTITLKEKQQVNAALLASGAPIDRMNIVRKHLSRVKGGQLARAAYPARMLSLMISDVPGDDPADIASGPTVGEASTSEDAKAILENHGLVAPDSVRRVLEAGSCVVPVGDPALALTENRIIATPGQSLKAAAKIARQKGLEVRILGDDLEGEARHLASAHAELALTLAATARSSPVLLLSGGECTVTRRGGGIGGPNAEYALALALALRGRPDITALACDTDGVDGAAEVAGAIIDATTLERAAVKGLNARAALDDNDAHSFFAALGDHVVTGPTLTNVNDFRAILLR